MSFDREKKSLRELFMREWDPIGVRGEAGAEDEYDSYIGEAWAMLTDRDATAGEIERYLTSTAVETMGLPASATLADKCRRTAEALVGLKPAFLTDR